MLMTIFLISLLAMSAVCASEDFDNSTISQDETDDLNQVDDDCLQEYVVLYINHNYPSKSGDNVTFECVNDADRSPVSDLDLAVCLDDGDLEKVTTDLNGNAVYSHNFTTGNHHIMFGLWDNGQLVSSLNNYEYYYGNNFDFTIVPHAKLEIINLASKYGDNNVTFKLTNIENNAPIANVDLGVLDKTNQTGYKITTNSEGIAVWNLPFVLGNCTILVGLGDEDGISSESDDLYCEWIKADISITHIPASLKLTKTGNSYKDTILTVSLVDSLNQPLANEKVDITFSNGKSTTVTTDSKGVATYSVPFDPGTYSAAAKAVSSYIKSDGAKLSNIVISKVAATITPTKLSTTYGSGKYFQVKVINSKNKKVLSGVKLKLKFYTGKKYKTVTLSTDSKGIAKYSASTLSLGTHKVIVTPSETKYVKASSKTSSVKVSKATIKISAPKVTNSYKQSQTFKVTVKNKESGKGMGGIKVSIKVYTGSKYKTFTAKTNSKGVVSINTKSLSKTTHKVAVNVKGNSKYKSASAKSSVKIVKTKIATHFVLSGMQYNYASNGVFSGVFVELKLLDSSGKEVGFKTVKMQIMRSYDDAPYGEEVSVLSNSGFHEVSCSLTGWDCYLKASFAGDSNYNACTSTFPI